MKKIIAATIVAILFIGSYTTTAFANAYTLEAENGKLLPPAGLGADLITGFQQKSDAAQDSPFAIQTQLSYGISPSITIAGEFSNSSGQSQTIVKALFSPMHEGKGYTVYGGYDLTQGTIPMLGLSLWADTRMLFGFVNLESRPNDQSIQVTPGATLKIGNLNVSGEISLDPGDLSTQGYSLGASYLLTNKVRGKLVYMDQEGLTPDKVISAGVNVQL